jgi:predicted RNA-binding protein
MSINLREMRRNNQIAWLFPISEEEWFSVKNLNIYGAYLEHRVGRRVEKGDVIIFYVTKTSSDSLGGNITGAYEVESDWYDDSTPIFPSELSGKKRMPLRVRIKPLRIGRVNLWDLSPKLNFIRRKDNPSLHFIGTPANSNKPLPIEDFQLIMSLMHPV